MRPSDFGFAGGATATCSNVTATSAVTNCGTATGIYITSWQDQAISGLCLTSISGNFSIDGATPTGGNNVNLGSISFPRLTYTTGFLEIINRGGGLNTAVSNVNLDSLVFVGGYFWIVFNSQLTAINLPSLTYVGQYFDVDSNFKLATISAPALVKIACAQNSCTQYGSAVYLCGNTASSISYSAAISHAAAGNLCYIPPGLYHGFAI